ALVERQFKIVRRVAAVLWEHELQLVTVTLFQIGSGLRRDADPVDRIENRKRAVGLDGNAESLRVKRVDQLLIDLQHGFAAGQDDQGLIARRGCNRPAGPREGFSGIELPTAFAVRADEIRIAKLADSLGAILFASGPQIAARKSAKYRW